MKFSVIETWENISTTIFHLWRDVTGGIINTSDDHRHCDLLAKGKIMTITCVVVVDVVTLLVVVMV